MIALMELRTITRAVALELARPVTVFDVVGAADEAAERDRRVALVRLARRGDP